MTGRDRFLAPPRAPGLLSDDAPPTFPPPRGGSGSSSSSGGGTFSLVDLLTAIWGFIKDLLSYLGDLTNWLILQASSPLSYPIRHTLYLVKLGLYEVYRLVRWLLALSGYVYPDPDQLGNALSQQFINPDGITTNMPHLEYTPYVMSRGEQQKCLFYPENPAEPPLARPGPISMGL